MYVILANVPMSSVEVLHVLPGRPPVEYRGIRYSIPITPRFLGEGESVQVEIPNARISRITFGTTMTMQRPPDPNGTFILTLNPEDTNEVPPTLVVAKNRRRRGGRRITVAAELTIGLSRNPLAVGAVIETLTGATKIVWLKADGSRKEVDTPLDDPDDAEERAMRAESPVRVTGRFPKIYEESPST